MSKTNEINRVIELIKSEKATILSKNVTVDDLKAICGKTFKQLIEKEPELLHPFDTYVRYNVKGSSKKYNQLYPFSHEEVIAAGEIVKNDNKKDLIWIPAASFHDKPFVEYDLMNISQVALESLAENGKRSDSATKVLKVKTVAKFDKLKELVEPTESHVLIPFNSATNMWRGVKKSGGKVTKAIMQARIGLKTAKENKDSEAIKRAEKLIEILSQQL